MTVKSVFFDMGGTIETFWYSPEMRLQVTPELLAVLRSAGIDLRITSHKMYNLVSTGLSRYHQWRLSSLDERSPYHVWKDYILPDYPHTHKQLARIADELMVWIETHYYRRTMRPEIPEVLDAIQKMGYKVGLISNVNSRGQVPLNLTEYGIRHHFDPIVLSSEYGRRKPDPSIFHYAARLSCTPTSECIYIGDRISRDILGARRAGYKLAIQIRHDFIHGESDEGATPDLIFSDMYELLAMLDKEYKASQQSRKEKSSENKIRAILFDADGVLYYRKNKDQEFNAFIREVARVNKNIPDPESLQVHKQAYVGQITYEQYKTSIMELYGITDPNLLSRGVQISLAERDKILFFDDARETLSKLKHKNLYLGIVTDTAQPLHVKISKLERGGIGNFWDSIIASHEVGVQKPDPKIYQLALQQLGISSNQAVFVGHKSSELDGARNVGLKTVAFNYDKDAKADFYIEKFSDLAALPIIN